MFIINHLIAVNSRMSRQLPAVLCLLLSIAFLLCYVQSQERFDCEENFCNKKENQCPELNCKNGRRVKNATICGCCDICVESLDKGKGCSKTVYGWSQNFKECGSGLFCNATGKCEGTACLKKVRKYNEEYPEQKHHLKINFTCDHFGNYDPVVCISDILCFCVNKEGKRIFGADFADNKKAMVCNCSRDIRDFPKTVEDESLFPRCLPNGNYDPLQCTEDKCFCMESSNQQEDDIANDDSSIGKLSCYNDVRHANGRTTKCLKQREEQMKLFKKNLTVIGMEPVRCDLDGSYFPVQCNPGRCFCVSKNGKIYDKSKYGIEKKNAKGMTCNCLRDKEVMEDLQENEDTMKYFKNLKCDELGNYESKSITAIQESFF